MVKSLPANAGDLRNMGLFDPWVGKIPWRRARQPTPVFFLENSMDRGAWRAIVQGAAESDTAEVTFHACSLGCCCC